MYTLSIEHEITDFPTWKQAFDRFESARAQAGVRAHRIRRLASDPFYLIIELDFDTEAGAEEFRQFLLTVVWSNPEASPALSGVPITRILAPAP